MVRGLCLLAGLALLLAACGGEVAPSPVVIVVTATPVLPGSPTAIVDVLATARVQVQATSTVQAVQTSTALAAVPLSASEQVYVAAVMSETTKLLDYLTVAGTVLTGSEPDKPRVIASLGLAMIVAGKALERQAPPRFADADIHYKAGLGQALGAWETLTANVDYWSPDEIQRAQLGTVGARADIMAALAMLPPAKK